MFDKIITTNTTETRDDNNSHIIELLEEILIRLEALENPTDSFPRTQQYIERGYPYPEEQKDV
jgi:hypothetical protein